MAWSCSHLRLGLRDLGLQHGDLRLRYVLLVQRHLVILLRIVQRRGGNHSIFRHADGAVVGALQQRHIGTFRVDLGALEVGLRTLQVGLRSFQRRARLLHLRLDLDLVELGQQLSLLDAVAVVHQQLLHNAAGLRLDFDLGDGRDLAGRHHALGQVALFHFGEFRRINLGAATRRRENSARDQQHDDRDHAAPDNQFATLLLIISVTVHNASCRYRQVEIGSHSAALTPYVRGLSCFCSRNFVINFGCRSRTPSKVRSRSAADKRVSRRARLQRAAACQLDQPSIKRIADSRMEFCDPKRQETPHKSISLSLLGIQSTPLKC